MQKWPWGSMLLLIVLFGCASHTKTLTWESENTKVSDFTAFVFQPVSDATGRGIKRAILSELDVQLRKEFVEIGLPIDPPDESKEKVLRVESDILVYETKSVLSPAPPARAFSVLCILRTLLIQTTAGDIVAEIITVSQLDMGPGLLEPENPKAILKAVAAVTAAEVAKMR